MAWGIAFIAAAIGIFFYWRSSQLAKRLKFLTANRWSNQDGHFAPIDGIIANPDQNQEEMFVLKQRLEFLQENHSALQAEIEKCIASEARYRTIVENQQEFIIRWSLSTFQATYANPAYCQYFQLPLEVVLGRDIRSDIHPEDQERIVAKFQTIGVNNPSIVLEHRIIYACQQLRWLKWMNHAIWDREGNITEIQSIGRDITEIKLVEEALQRIESRNRALLEGIPDTMFLLNRQGIFLDFRSRSPVVTEPGKVLYSSLREFPEFAGIADQILDSIAVAIETGALQSFEYCRELPEEIFYYEARITASGEQEAVMLVRDITDRKRVEEAALALTREQEINQLQQHFFAMISHEFRTPLHVMRMSIGILENANPNWRNEKVARNLQRIKAASDRILSTIDNMVTIYQVETEFFEPIWEPIQVASFCQSLIAEIESTSDCKIVLTYDRTNQNVYSDLRLLRCIISNLLTNAMKYSQGEIEVEVRHEVEKVRLSIRDRGIGIPAHELADIFTPFFRASNVSNLNGSGLGLSVVKKCVEVFAGDIQVVSKEGVGTTFLVILPVHPPLY